MRPGIFRKRSLGAWLVFGLVATFVVATLMLFFEAVAPVSDFWFRPGVNADSGTYWLLSGIRGSSDLSQNSGSNDQPQYGGGSWGPVLQAKIVRTDLGVLISNCAIFALMLWIVGTMKEFDLATFALLMVLNPILFSAIATLNKEIYSALGIVFTLRYITAKRFRMPLLLLAFVASLGGHWQQAVLVLMLAAVESRISPLRGKFVAGTVTLLVALTIGYTVVYHFARFIIAALLAQAEAGRLIILLDNIQGNLGLPLVVIPKILMNVMGHLSTPWYFLSEYWGTDFSNWYDQFFTQGQEFLTTILLFVLFFRRQLPLRQPLVYLLTAYLMMTAVNPMVQPRYEYAAYVLLCLQASRYYPLGLRKSKRPDIPTQDTGQAILPSLS